MSNIAKTHLTLINKYSKTLRIRTTIRLWKLWEKSMEKQQCNNRIDIELAMSRMNEFSYMVTELRHCGETLIAVSEKMTALFTGNPVVEEMPNAEPQEKEKNADAPSIFLEEVRALCAEKSEEGFDVRALIKKYGAEKLSEVDPAKYAALIADLQGTQK